MLPPLAIHRLRLTVVSVLREHKLIIALSAAYIAAGGIVQHRLNRPWPVGLVPFWFVQVWILSSAAYIAIVSLGTRRRPTAWLSAQSVMTALIVVVLVEPIHVTFQSLKQSIGATLGFPMDRTWSAIDIMIHGGPAWKSLSFLLSPTAIRALDVAYMLWFLELFVFLLWCSWSMNTIRRRQATLAWLLLWIVGGTVAAWAGASAGPFHYQPSTGAPNPYEHLMRHLDSVGFSFARLSQYGLIHLQPGPFAGVSAMPSMHVGLACLVALVGWRHSRFLGALLYGFAFLTHIGSIVLGWHYAIDGYAGALLAILCWRAGQKWIPAPAAIDRPAEWSVFSKSGPSAIEENTA
jgi:hypothetical protein